MNDIKHIILFLLLAYTALIAADTNVPLDESTELSGKDRIEAIRFFEECFDIVQQGNGPISTIKVIDAREQFVSGAAYIYNGNLMDSNSTIMDCIIKIWDGLTTNIQINCYGTDPQINITI